MQRSPRQLRNMQPLLPPRKNVRIIPPLMDITTTHKHSLSIADIAPLQICRQLRRDHHSFSDTWQVSVRVCFVYVYLQPHPAALWGVSFWACSRREALAVATVASALRSEQMCICIFCIYDFMCVHEMLQLRTSNTICMYVSYSKKLEQQRFERQLDR